MVADEAAFLQGRIGVDGRPADEPDDAEARARTRAREALIRNRTWLGRELLTWVLYRSCSVDPLTSWDGEDVEVVLVGAVVLRGLAGDATEVRVKGSQAGYADVVREALARGLLVHQGRLRIQCGERVFEVTLDAEYLALRSASIPKLPRGAEEGVDAGGPSSAQAEAERMHRLEQVDHLAALIDAIWAAFVDVRRGPEWVEREVPAMRAWMASARSAGGDGPQFAKV